MDDMFDMVFTLAPSFDNVSNEYATPGNQEKTKQTR